VHGTMSCGDDHADGKSREAEVFLHHKEVHRVPLAVRVTPIMDTEGKIIGASELFSDISSAKSIETRIKEPPCPTRAQRRMKTALL